MKLCELVLILAIIAGVTPVASQNASPAFREQYWKAGELDPARNKQWTKPAVYEDRLERIPVTPQYTLYISEGDCSNSADYFHVHPKYESDGTLSIKPFRQHHAVILFVDLGRAMPGTVEFEANPPEGVVISFETGEAMHSKQKYAVDSRRNKKEVQAADRPCRVGGNAVCMDSFRKPYCAVHPLQPERALSGSPKQLCRQFRM